MDVLNLYYFIDIRVYIIIDGFGLDEYIGEITLYNQQKVGGDNFL